MYCSHCGKQIPEKIKFCPNCGKSVSFSSSPPQENVEPVYGLASSGLRLANYLLDRFIVIIFVFIIAGVGSVLLKEEALYVVVLLTFFIGYDVFFESIWQRTPAKWITKTKVVMIDGSKPGFWRVLGRTLARYIPFEPLSFLFSPMGWHDSLSKTIVVPSNYGIEEIKQIDPKHATKSKASTAIIILIGFFVGIAVIGLLASVVLLALNSARVKSRDAKRVADIRTLGSGLELFFDANNRYPHALAELTPTYLASIPEFPIPKDGTCTDEQNRYSYTYVSDADYKLDFCLGGKTGDISSGPHTMTPQGFDKSTLDSTKETLSSAESQTSLADSNTQISKQINLLEKKSRNNSPVEGNFPNIDIKPFVLIGCLDESDNMQTGSGTIISSDGYVLTNEHVVTDDNGNALQCFMILRNDNSKSNIAYIINTDAEYAGYYTNSDAAVLKVVTAIDIDSGVEVNLPNVFPFYQLTQSTVKQGEAIYIVGYPGSAENVFNIAKGIVSSFSPDGNFVNTDAIIDHGNSGGAALTADGTFFGIPTQKYTANNDYLGQILRLDSIDLSIFYNQ